MKRKLPTVESRTFDVKELRLDGEKGRFLVGHAAVFDKLSVPIWGFRERIKKGAFAKTIQEADIRALWNHDTNQVLGRNKAGTLELSEDELGLAVKIDLPRTQWAEDHRETIRRGDVSQMSFAFKTIKDYWYTEDGENRRDLLEVALIEVSPVTFPVYPDTDIGARGMYAASAGNSESPLFRALMRLHAGDELSAEELNLVRGHIEALSARVSQPEPAVGHSGAAGTAAVEPPKGHSPEMLRKRLALYEKQL